MDVKVPTAVFASIFVAELGDKTRLATLFFASETELSKLAVFVAASAALVVATGIGVLAGELVSKYVNPAALKFLAGAGFISIGIWTLAHT